jgi:hypothetical protein
MKAVCMLCSKPGIRSEMHEFGNGVICGDCNRAVGQAFRRPKTLRDRAGLEWPPPPRGRHHLPPRRAIVEPFDPRARRSTPFRHIVLDAIGFGVICALVFFLFIIFA